MEFTNDNEKRLYEIVNKDLPDLQHFLYYILIERGQLYGALAYLMNLTETEQFHYTRDMGIDLLTTPILACCPEGGTVLDPFMGSGTTAVTSQRLNRK